MNGIFKCSKCHKVVDLKKDPHAMDGWRITPVVVCWECNLQAIEAEISGPQEAQQEYMNRVLSMMGPIVERRRM